MAIELFLTDGNPLNFKPGLPNNYAGPVLPGSLASFTISSLAEIVIQELAGDQYSVRLSVGHFFQRITAGGKIRKQGLYSSFMLKNGMRKEVGSIGKMHVRQDQYSCFYTEPTPCKARFEKDKEYTTIDIFYSPKLLEELLPFFPELKSVLSSKSALVADKACWALPSMKEITNQLLLCPFDEATRQFYFDLKARELLYQMLENTYKRNRKTFSFTPWETARIHQARTILESYISRKPPSIRSLSKQVALNEFKLKTGFKL